jgi:K+ transporter
MALYHRIITPFRGIASLHPFWKKSASSKNGPEEPAPSAPSWRFGSLFMAFLGFGRSYTIPQFYSPPRAGLGYFREGGQSGFLMLGGVFLCVSDGRRGALCGHGTFRRQADPPSLVGTRLLSIMLNDAGQPALVLEGAPTTDNFFYRLCPPFILVPLVLLATIATIIASQSIITGAYSMTQQAIQLGWLPRLQSRIRSDRLARIRGWRMLAETFSRR